MSAQSWPVEIGLSWLKGEKVRTWASLIRPDQSWDLDDWSQTSAAVHGITLAELREAPKRSQVVRTFHQTLGWRRLVSDAPEFEQRWLTRFLGLDPLQAELPVEDIDAITFAAFDAGQIARMHEAIRRINVPHSAGPDAARMAAGWRAAIGLDDE